MADRTTLCAAICTFNRYDLLGTAIDSLLRQEGIDGQMSILVVDNSPDPVRAADEATKYATHPLVTYIHVDRPGLSNARNVAANRSSADIVAYLDDDAIASSRWARALIDAFDSHPQAAIVGGPVLPMWEVDRPAWLSDKLSSYVSVVDWGGDQTRVAAPGEWFAGANIAFRRELLVDAGGFDTSLGRIGSGASLLSNEETKVTERLRELGYLSVYVPSAPVDHLVERARLTQGWFRRRVVWQAVSDYLASGGKSLEALQSGWTWSLRYLSALPPADRSFRGLFAPCQGPKEFEDQLSALYNYAFNMLAGFPCAVANS